MLGLTSAFRRVVRHRDSSGHADIHARSFIAHNRKVWGSQARRRSQRVVLADFHQLHGTLILWSYHLNILAAEHGARIAAYTFDPPQSWPRKRRFRGSSTWRLWESFNTTDLVYCQAPCTRLARQRIEETSQSLVRETRTKADIFDIEISEYRLGLDIYESYLRDGRQLSDPGSDPALHQWITKFVGWTAFWEQYFERNEVVSVLVSHDTYHHNILCRIANARNIPVYSTALGMSYRVSRPFMFARRYRHLRKWFLELPEEERAKGLQRAKQKLEQKFAGSFITDSPYVDKSPFHGGCTEQPVLRSSSKFKVLIATHCFFDNPHSYDGMLFPDFYEWILFLKEVADQTNYDWYIKVHRDPLPGTLEALGALLGQNSKITMISPEVSHQQLIGEGIGAALTCYGTIGIEYAALGVPVVNACRGNPHNAYSFNFQPGTIDEYTNILMSLPEHCANLKIKMEDVHECYFMKHDFLSPDWPGELAYEKIMKSLGPQKFTQSAIFEHFLQYWTPDLHSEILVREKSFLLGGGSFNTKYGPKTDSEASGCSSHVQFA